MTQPFFQNPQLFKNIEIICDAIERRKQITLTQMIYGIDKELHEAFALSVTPVAIFIVEQEYMILYIWDLNQDDPEEEFYPIIFTTVIRNLGPINICEEVEAIDIDSVEALHHKSIPLFIRDNAVKNRGAVYSPESGELRRITIICKRADIDDIVYRFGKDVWITKLPEFDENLFDTDVLWKSTKLYKDLIRVSVHTKKNAATDFVFAHLPYAFILSPEDVKLEYQSRLTTSMKFMDVIPEKWKNSKQKQEINQKKKIDYVDSHSTYLQIPDHLFHFIINNNKKSPGSLHFRGFSSGRQPHLKLLNVLRTA